MRPVEIELFSPHDGLRETSNSGSEQALNTIFHKKNFSQVRTLLNILTFHGKKFSSLVLPYSALCWLSSIFSRDYLEVALGQRLC